MRFRTKIIVVYAMFALVTSVILGGSYYITNSVQARENQYRIMNNTSDQFIEYFEQTIDSMEFVFNYILSDSQTVDALITLASQPNTELEDVYFSEAANIIRSKLNTDYIWANYHRVIVFNDFGSIITGNNLYIDPIDYNTKIEDILWLEDIKNRKGESVIIGKHFDDWGVKGDTEVISLVKELQGMSMGYIEVQKKVSDLDNLFKPFNENMNVVIISEGQEVIYSTQQDCNSEFYIENTFALEEGIHNIMNPSTDKKEIVSKSNSLNYGAYILVIQDLESILEESFNILPITILITLCFFCLFISFIIIVSNKLTKPLKSISDLMEKTEIENLHKGVEIDDSEYDEIQRLNQSYQNVLRRLNASITKEKRLSYLQLQAQFDLLQAQVNPHFLYNVLNVISSRGVVNDDEITCNICECLASILRYSTNTKERYATVGTELEHLEEYFYILQSRYRDKLEYKVNVLDEVKMHVIPKIVIQQLVENSVAHGYQNVSRVMRIEISGWQDKDMWYLKVKDNGEGFLENQIIDLENQIKKVREQLVESNDNMEMEFGGMGIINTYARLFLQYNSKVSFTIRNAEQGAEVLIGVREE